ncbi:MAG: hypothetical protein ABFS12_07070 [Bacteroidota bacterium]
MLNFNWLADIPIDSAKWIFLILFILIGVLILFVPNKFIYEGLEKISWFHNLKIWAIGLLGFIFVVYYIF